VAEARENVLMDSAAIDRALNRITHEILERHADLTELALVGIRSRGVPLAERLRRRIAAVEHRDVPVGILDITLYRDDLTTIGPHAVLKETRISFPIDGRRIILVDDVLYTGRTVRAALDGLVDFGRPRSIHLAVLIDRGHRELPIHADYIGRTVVTRPEEMVAVRLSEIDGRDEVILQKRAAHAARPEKKLRAAPARPAGRSAARRIARPAR
jgi:pyrimidine operon attenuation protein/uracil phosphoribosyltransferase